MQIHNGTLTNTSVSIEIGNNLCAYVNSARGRALIEAECTEDIVKAVFAVWGDKPTVTEPTYPTPPAPQPSEVDKLKQQLAYTQASQIALQAYIAQMGGAL